MVPQQLLRDMDVAIRSADDGRQIDAVAYGLTALPLCCDATLVCPLDSQGQPKYSSDKEDGAALCAAARRKRRRYPELAAGDRGRLVLLGCETGGRWAEEAWQLLDTLAAARSSAAPSRLQKTTHMSWRRRWAALVSVSAQAATAAALAEPPALGSAGAPAAAPDLVDVLEEAKRNVAATTASRLAWRSS